MNGHDWYNKWEPIAAMTVICKNCGIEKDQYDFKDYSLWIDNKAVDPRYYNMTCDEIIMEEILK